MFAEIVEVKVTPAIITAAFKAIKGTHRYDALVLPRPQFRQAGQPREAVDFRLRRRRQVPHRRVGHVPGRRTQVHQEFGPAVPPDQAERHHRAGGTELNERIEEPATITCRFLNMPAMTNLHVVRVETAMVAG